MHIHGQTEHALSAECNAGILKLIPEVIAQHATNSFINPGAYIFMAHRADTTVPT